MAGLFPVGRLDVSTEGLILLTNDGAFAERVAHPRYEVPRVYHAKVRNVPEPETLERMRRGVTVEGERLAADRVRLLESDNNAWVEVTLHEGKHHEVRRLLEAVGPSGVEAPRVSIGPLTVRGLEPGEFRALTPHEVQSLLKPGARPPAPAPRPPHEAPSVSQTRARRGAQTPGHPGARSDSATRREHGLPAALSGDSSSRGRPARPPAPLTTRRAAS